MRFALAVPRRRMAFKFAGPVSELIGREDVYVPLADLLAQKIASYDELLALPTFGMLPARWSNVSRCSSIPDRSFR
jgi:hypothetical protein